MSLSIKCFLWYRFYKWSIILTRGMLTRQIPSSSAWIIFANLFYYSTYFCYCSCIPLHFLVLFMGFIVLFQLIFTFIYSIFSKKNLFQLNKQIPNRHVLSHRSLPRIWVVLWKKEKKRNLNKNDSTSKKRYVIMWELV